MDFALEDVLDENYGPLSLKVSQYPKNLKYWEQVLNYLLKKASPLNKSIDERLANLIRFTYSGMLSHFPFLENYYIDYALFELKLGNVKEMHRVFKEGLLKFNNRSLLLWVEYLKLCNELIADNKQLFRKYELAEQSVGLHFFSGEFWELYLDQILLRSNSPKPYLLVLRKVLEVPIYSFSAFYSKWLTAVDEIRDLKQLTYFLPELEVAKRLKIDMRKVSRRGPDVQDAKRQLKKFTKELYMVVQHRTLEIYNLFEIHLKTQFQTSYETLLSYDEIVSWRKYLNYTIETGEKTLIMLNFQRALVPLAHYDIIWLMYANWLQKDETNFAYAKNVLLQGLQISQRKVRILKSLALVLIRLGKRQDLINVFGSLQEAFGNKIEAVDDFELFMDYFKITTFLQELVSQGDQDLQAARNSLSFDPPLVLAMKRLSYGTHKNGQMELLHVLCEMYNRFSGPELQREIFDRILDQGWEFYLSNGKFWLELCKRIWFDTDISYLEKRRYITKTVWPKAARYRKTTKPEMDYFRKSYLPEDSEAFASLFKCVHKTPDTN